MLVVNVEFKPYIHYNELLKKVLSNPGQGNSKCYILDNWKCFSFLKMFRLSSEQVLVVDLITASGRVSHHGQQVDRR